jgi:hypothetical protein
VADLKRANSQQDESSAADLRRKWSRTISKAAGNLSKASWSWGCVLAIDSNGERSGLLTRIETTEKGSSCGPTKADCVSGT